MPIDINRFAAAAAEAYLRQGPQESSNGRPKNESKARLGGFGAVALGAGLAFAARAVYTRVRHLDLEQAADRVEGKLTGEEENG